MSLQFSVFNNECPRDDERTSFTLDGPTMVRGIDRSPGQVVTINDPRGDWIKHDDVGVVSHLYISPVG